MNSARTTRPRFSIGAKLALATTGVLLVVSSLLFRELTRREQEALVTSKATAAAMVADLFAASLAAPLDFEDADAVHSELKNLEANPEVRCAAVFQRSGELSARLDRGCDATGPIAGAMTSIFSDRVEVTRVVEGRNGVVGRARVVFSLARENAAYAASRTRILWLTLLLAGGTALVLTLIARTQIVKPLRRLAEAARRVGAGDFSSKVEVRSADEMRDLAGAFNRMSEEIGDRESRLKAVTQNLRDLFDHMGQAIVAFDRDGKVHGEVSREALRVFSAESLEGRPIHDLLYADDVSVEAQTFTEWASMAFEADSASWNELAELAPHEVTVTHEGKALPLELEFRPVRKDDELNRVMMLATDVSEKRRLEKAIDTAEEEHKRRMAAMRRLVAGGAQLFVGFLEVTEDRLRRARARIEELATDDELFEAFRHVHTAKGESRAFELRELEAILEETESALSRLRRGARAETLTTKGEVIDALGRCLDALTRAREDFVAVSPVGRAALDLVTVRKSDLDAVLSLGRGRDRSLDDAVDRLASRPFGETTATVAERAPEWAARDGKMVEIVVEGREVPIPPRLATVLSGVLAHLVRNAIAHGVEPEPLRLERGKAPAGTVWISATLGDQGPIITVEDDGAGIDLEAVGERARELGVEGDPHELIFHPGLSTRDSSDGLAGRGVGLDAARVYLREAGYTIDLVTEEGRGTKFTVAP